MKSRQWIVFTGGILLLVIAVIGFRAGAVYLFPSNTPKADEAVVLSTVVLIGFILIVALMAALVIVYRGLKLANKDEALALPAGSVRALIAFSLVLIFVCLGAFLYNSVNTVDVKGGSGKLTKITQTQIDELQKEFVVAYEPALDDKGAQLYDTPRDEKGKLPEGAKQLYNATYFSKRSKEADDFAKQIFTTLATVFVSVISFYFGSATAAAKAQRDGGTGGKTIPPPSITKLDPNPIVLGSPPTPLTIIGDNLASVTKVKFDNIEVQRDSAADKLVKVTVPAEILIQTGKTVKVSVVGDNGESTTIDLTVG